LGNENSVAGHTKCVHEPQVPDPGLVHEKQALKTIASKMSNLSISNKRQGFILLYKHNNKQLTGPHKTFNWATCRPQIGHSWLRV